MVMIIDEPGFLSTPGKKEKKPLRFIQNIGAVGCSNFNRGYNALMVIG